MAIVRNIQNNQLYQYLGGTKYKNLITGVEGEVADEVAKKLFRVNLEATKILHEFPNIEKLISELGLTIDNYQKTEK
jgi:hypothetical protein